jgi:hypothetical protein
MIADGAGPASAAGGRETGDPGSAGERNGRNRAPPA